MNGIEQIIGPIFHAGNRYSIPPYQRQYQWTSERWQSLVSDVASETSKADSEPTHWLGILLLTTEGMNAFPTSDSVLSFSVVDGQQRLVTLLIWMAALSHHAIAIGSPSPIDLSKLSKIEVQLEDTKALEFVLKNQWDDHRASGFANSQILRAYRYFRYLLWLGQAALNEEHPIRMPSWKQPKENETIFNQWENFVTKEKNLDIPRGPKVDLEALTKATRQRLSIYVLKHDPRNDEPVASIFDTLNGMRTELEPLDHAKNSIFVRLDNTSALNLYNKHWLPAERILREVKLRGLNPGVSFLYDFVIASGEKKRQGSINKNRGAVHLARMTKDFDGPELVSFLEERVIPSMLSWPVVVRDRDSVRFQGQEVRFSKKSLDLLDSIRDLSRNPVNPLLLLYTCAFIKGELTDGELQSRFFKIENFLARQVLASIPLSPLRTRIMDVASELNSNTSLLALDKALKKANWPSDAAILRSGLKAEYGEKLDPSQLGAIFRGIEKRLSGSGAMKFKIGPEKDDYTIEHIYPRKDAKWTADLTFWGTDSRKMAEHLQTLGNLTVVTKEHNSKVGNSKLKTKQEHPTRIGSAAPLNIHKDWISSPKWTEIEIQKRTTKLLKAALEHWPQP